VSVPVSRRKPAVSGLVYVVVGHPNLASRRTGLGGASIRVQRRGPASAELPSARPRPPQGHLVRAADNTVLRLARGPAADPRTAISTSKRLRRNQGLQVTPLARRAASGPRSSFAQADRVGGLIYGLLRQRTRAGRRRRQRRSTVSFQNSAPKGHEALAMTVRGAAVHEREARARACHERMRGKASSNRPGRIRDDVVPDGRFGVWKKKSPR